MGTFQYRIKAVVVLFVIAGCPPIRVGCDDERRQRRWVQRVSDIGKDRELKILEDTGSDILKCFGISNVFQLIDEILKRPRGSLHSVSNRPNCLKSYNNIFGGQEQNKERAFPGGANFAIENRCTKRPPKSISTKLHAVDRRVGDQLRQRRVSLGMSQSQLASALGVSYQQVQKYERGASRIGASRPL